MKLVKEDLKHMEVFVKSETSGKIYTITLTAQANDPSKQYLKCSCPSWKYNNNPKDGSHARVCKHIQQFLDEQVHPNTRRLLNAGYLAGLRSF